MAERFKNLQALLPLLPALGGLAVRRSDLNDKGEIVDPWGTPFQFYFSHNEVLIRSAGPNKVWEDSAVASDDLFRCASKDKQ